jgi:putative ABC transport system ATP-binding protein
MIRLENVSRRYGDGSSTVAALDGVTTSIEAGSFVTIVGASGSGKSTLLNLLGALDRPTEGRVLLDGTDLSVLDDDARTLLRRDRIGFVFQFFNLLPTLTAIENVCLPANLAGKRGRETQRRADELLEKVGLTARRGHKPDQLSGGEMQRVAIARALVMNPLLVLADEPTGNLDSKTGHEVLTLLQGLVAARRTVVLVTHDPHVAEQGERVLTMADGKLISDRPGRSREQAAG